MSSPQITKSLQQATWRGSLPLEISLAPSDSRLYDQTDLYYVHFPRLSYLPFLLERLHAFFQSVLIDPSVSPSIAWFSFEGVPLKWHHPAGLLYDLFSGATPATATSSASTGPSSTSSPASASSPLPWRLRIHYSSFPTHALVQLDPAGKAMHDAFINSVKEADFLRNGTANAIMKLNIEHSNALWESVLNHNLAQFVPIYHRLLPETSSLRHVPLRVYLPATDAFASPAPAIAADLSQSPTNVTGLASSPHATESSPNPPQPQAAGHLRVVQSLVKPFISGTREAQTLGTALNAMLPALFPSRRRVVLARPVLHGAVVPLEAGLEDLMRGAAYADGWLNLGIEMII